MSRRTLHVGAFSAAFLAVFATFAMALPLEVNNFGDGGWTNGDTRDGAGVNVGPAGRLDLNISSPGLPPSGHNSLRLTTATNNDKATIHQTGLSLGTIANLSGGFSWYKENAGAAAPALKLGIDTSDVNVPSSRPGESAFDKFLIYEPYANPASGDPGTGVWVSQSFSLNSGLWWLRDRNTGTNYNLPYAGLTLAQWLADGTFGTLLSSGDIVAVQIGQGSGNPGLTAYVDALDYTYGVSPTTNSYVFGTVTPEPASISLLALGALALCRRSRK